MELAINDGDNKKNKDRNDSNGDYPIRSHPVKYLVRLAFQTSPRTMGREKTNKEGGSLPTGHAPQSLNASINVAFTLVQVIARMLNRLSLDV